MPLHGCAVGEALRRAALDTGYSHYLGRFVGGRIAVTASAEGVRSPFVDEALAARLPGVPPRAELGVVERAVELAADAARLRDALARARS